MLPKQGQQSLSLAPRGKAADTVLTDLITQGKPDIWTFMWKLLIFKCWQLIPN